MSSVNKLINENSQFLADIKNNPNRYMDFLHTMAKFYKYPLTQQINLYFHAPEAAWAVANKHIIDDVLHWELDIEAPAIEILGPNSDTLETVYDIRFTKHYKEQSKEQPNKIVWKYEPEKHHAIIEDIFQGEGELSERILGSFMTNFNTLSPTGNENTDELLALTSTYIILDRLGYNAEDELGMQFILHDWQDFEAKTLLDDARTISGAALKKIEYYVKNSNISNKEQEDERNSNNDDREHISGSMGKRKEDVPSEREAGALAGDGRKRDDSAVPGELSGGVPEEVRDNQKTDHGEEASTGVTAGGDGLAGVSEHDNDSSRDDQGAGIEGNLRDGLTGDISLDDFDFSADMSTTAGKRAVFQINLAAIRLVKKLDAEKRGALPNEITLLKNYRGFGGMPEVFDEFNSAWKNEYAALKEAMTSEEYNTARDSVLNAHYTSPELIKAVYGAVQQMGFAGGNILEPALGSGRFFDAMPEEMRSASNLVGVELDSMTSKIAAYAHPDAKVLNKGFEATSFANGSFDLAISNVPFGDYKIKSDLAYRDKSMYIHDYFIAKMIDQVRPGGIVAAITSSGTMDKQDDTARKYMTKHADFIGAFRLPESAFKSAGTEVTTDIIFFRKKDPASELDLGEKNLPNVHAFNNGPGGIYRDSSQYFDRNPEHVMGSMERRRSRYGGMESFCANTLDKPVHEALTEAFKEYIPADFYTPNPDMPIPAEVVPPTKNAVGFFYEDNRIVHYDGNGNKESLELAPDEMQRTLSALHIRDAARKLIDGQRNYCNNEELAALQKELNRHYEDYVKRYGRIQLDTRLKKIMEHEPSYPLIRSLEVFDHKVFSRKADIFYKRTINPDIAPVHADTSEDALKISMNYKGGVDLDYMVQLTDSSREQIISDMEFSSIYYNPEKDAYELADEYLSGNIYQKIEQVESAIKNLRIRQQELIINSLYPNWDKFDFSPKNDIEKKIYEYVLSGADRNSLPSECFDYLHQHYDDLKLMALAKSQNLIVMPRQSEEENHNALRINLLAYKLTHSLHKRYWRTILQPLLENNYPEKEANALYAYFWTNPNYNLGESKAIAPVIYKYLEKKMEDWPDTELHKKYNADQYVDHNKAEAFAKTEIADFSEFMQHEEEQKAQFIQSDTNYQEIEKRIQKLQKNIDALNEVKPKDLTPGDIDVKLGTTWIKSSDIKDFLIEELDISYFDAEKFQVEFSKLTGEWRITNKSSVGEFNTKIHEIYGTPDKTALELCELALNLRDAKVYTTIVIDGQEKRRVNQKATLSARIKQQNLKDAFQKWFWNNPERSKRTCAYYNRHFNNIKPREYNGDFLTFPGMSADITLQKHQRDAIAHTLYGGNTLLAHCVGAGKSYEMIASAMESRRLGLAKKPMLVVPKHLTEQMGEDFHRLYPDAKILIASDKTFTAQNRKEFCSKIATQDWDAIIMGYTQFERVPLSIERQKITLQEQINEITEAAREYSEHSGKGSFTVKQMVKMRKKLEAKLESLKKSAKDETVTFEDLGVDKLYVDEAHYFKNLYTPTKLGNVSGIQTTEAAKTMDFYQKCKYINEITDYRGLVFATGTPISNSMTELYTMQRYLQPQRLAESDMGYFDAWAANFGQQVTEMEINPEGQGFRERTKFVRFQNLPELMATFKEVADIKTADMLNLPTPDEEIIVERMKPTDMQKSYVNLLSRRAEQVRSGNIDTSEDNMLKITNEGRLLALDQRLMIPDAPDNPNSKTNRCIENVLKVYREGMADLATQLIFCDKSTPNKDGKFNVYDDIKSKLIAQGVPENEIAFIHDAKTDKQKNELFEKVRKGKVRILLGSTDKLGVGTNIQDRLVATHDLDVPWRPSDLEQRKGRICRRGNQNSSVKIFRYITEGTFDAYMWQILENKQRFISQVMTSRAPSRTTEDCDEVTLSYAEVKACATGNPLIKEKMELDNEIKRLEIDKSNFLSSHDKLQHKCNIEYPIQIKSLESLISKLQEMKTQMDNNTVMVANAIGEQEELFFLELNGKQYISPAEANAAILDASKCDKLSEVSGHYRGLVITLERDPMTSNIKVVLSHKARRECDLSFGSDTSIITAMNKMLRQLPTDIKTQQNRLESLRQDCETIKLELQKPFDKEEILKEKLKRQKAIDLQIQMAVEGKDEMARRIDSLEDILDENGTILPSRLPADELTAACMAHAAYIYKFNGNNWPEDGNYKLFAKLADQYEVTAYSFNKFNAFDIQQSIQEISPTMPSGEDMAHIIDKYCKEEENIAMAEYQVETGKTIRPTVAFAR